LAFSTTGTPVLIINDLRHFYGKNTLFLELSNLLHKKLGLSFYLIEDQKGMDDRVENMDLTEYFQSSISRYR